MRNPTRVFSLHYILNSGKHFQERKHCECHGMTNLSKLITKKIILNHNILYISNNYKYIYYTIYYIKLKK